MEKSIQEMFQNYNLAIQGEASGAIVWIENPPNNVPIEKYQQAIQIVEKKYFPYATTERKKVFLDPQFPVTFDLAAIAKEVLDRLATVYPITYQIEHQKKEQGKPAYVIPVHDKNGNKITIVLKCGRLKHPKSVLFPSYNAKLQHKIRKNVYLQTQFGTLPMSEELRQYHETTKSYYSDRIFAEFIGEFMRHFLKETEEIFDRYTSIPTAIYRQQIAVLLENYGGFIPITKNCYLVCYWRDANNATRPKTSEQLIYCDTKHTNYQDVMQEFIAVTKEFLDLIGGQLSYVELPHPILGTGNTVNFRQVQYTLLSVNTAADLQKAIQLLQTYEELQTQAISQLKEIVRQKFESLTAEEEN